MTATGFAAITLFAMGWVAGMISYAIYLRELHSIQKFIRRAQRGFPSRKSSRR